MNSAHGAGRVIRRGRRMRAARAAFAGEVEKSGAGGAVCTRKAARVGRARARANYRKRGARRRCTMKARRAEAAGRRRARKGERTMTVRALGERIEAYFAACDATRERMEQRNGAAAYRQVPYTLAGLAAATGLGKAELLRLAADGGRRGALVRAALLRVERHLSERALMGELQATMAQALLRELAPEAAGEGDERRVVVVLDDREGWSG